MLLLAGVFVSRLRVCICLLPQGDNPVYVWAPLGKPRRRRDKAGPGEEEMSELQVGGGWLLG